MTRTVYHIVSYTSDLLDNTTCLPSLKFGSLKQYDIQNKNLNSQIKSLLKLKVNKCTKKKSTKFRRFGDNKRPVVLFRKT